MKFAKVYVAEPAFEELGQGNNGGLRIPGGLRGRYVCQWKNGSQGAFIVNLLMSIIVILVAFDGKEQRAHLPLGFVEPSVVGG